MGEERGERGGEPIIFKEEVEEKEEEEEEEEEVAVSLSQAERERERERESPKTPIGFFLHTRIF